MEVGNQPNLKILSVDFTNIIFSATKGYENDSPIQFDVTPKVFYPAGHPEIFKIIFDTHLHSEGSFDLKISAIGSFELAGDLTDDIKKSFVNKNAPAIMFPYLRSFVSTFTSNLGNVTGHILIPTQFLKGDLEEIQIAE